MRRKQKHKPSTRELEDHMFDSGPLEDAGKFVKAKEALINYIHMPGEHKTSYVTDSLKAMDIQGPPRPERPPQITDPAQGVALNTTIDGVTEIIVWEGDLRYCQEEK